MHRFLLLDDTDVQQAFATHLRHLREQANLFRAALAQRSSVPAPTIKKFETSPGKYRFANCCCYGKA